MLRRNTIAAFSFKLYVISISCITSKHIRWWVWAQHHLTLFHLSKD
jgi:hypothetical protein